MMIGFEVSAAWHLWDESAPVLLQLMKTEWQGLQPLGHQEGMLSKITVVLL